MSTLISKLRSITSTESDDYFTDEYLLDLLNRGKQHIVEKGMELERSRGVSLRFLDQLRTTQDVSFKSFSSYEDFYKTTADQPSDLDDWISFDLDGVNLSELRDLFEVKHGNALPSAEEGYFLVYDSDFEFYLDSDTYSSFTLRYIKNASDITDTDTSVSDLGEGAERVILYHAATLMADSDVTIPAKLFQDQFNQYVRDLL